MTANSKTKKPMTANSKTKGNIPASRGKNKMLMPTLCQTYLRHIWGRQAVVAVLITMNFIFNIVESQIQSGALDPRP